MRRRAFPIMTMLVGALAVWALPFGASTGATPDDGWFDRWTPTSVSCNEGQIVVSYDRTYNHPVGADVLGTWERLTPAPVAAVLNPFASTNVSGGSGSGSFVIGTGIPAAVVYPGTYRLSRQILVGGSPTYRQDLDIVCSAPGSGTWTSTEDLYLPAEPLPSTVPADVAGVVVAQPRSTG